MRETRAYTKLKKLYPRAHWIRIESWTEPGIFDLNGCFNGCDVWIECKQVTRPKTRRGMIKPEVKKEQVVWEHNRRKVGGATYVALMVDMELYLFHGIALSALKKGVTQEWIEETHLRADPAFMFGFP